MKLLTFKTASEALLYYPGLENYLHQFVDPKIALLGKFTNPEKILVEHMKVGTHRVITIPIFNNELSYRNLKEIYVGSKLNDTFTVPELPYGYESNYETFLIMTECSCAAMLEEQPKIDDVVLPTFMMKMVGTDNAIVTLNGVEFSKDSSGKYYLPASQAHTLLDEVVDNVFYSGSLMMYNTEGEVTAGGFNAMTFFRKDHATYGKSYCLGYDPNTIVTHGEYIDGKFILSSDLENLKLKYPVK